MANNQSKVTVNMSSVDTMTISELRNAKKIIEKKLEENQGNAFLSEKLTNLLYTYEKKEKDINNFYKKCINHKNPKVVQLVNGKRNLLRAMDIKKVSRNGKLRDLIYKPQKDTLDYGAKDFLKDHLSDVALGAGIAAMGAGVASINFGDVSLISLLKQALTKLFGKNALSSALFMSGATLIAVGLSAKLIKKKVQHIKNRQNLANKVQNEISNEMNKDLPDINPEDLKTSRFKSAKDNIVQNLYNSPELLSMYEEALRQPQKYGLSATQRLNLVEALKEAYSKIDDFDRVRRGEPTKAELAEINKQKEQDTQNYNKCKGLISKFNSSVEALSEKSADKDFSALKTQIDSIKSTISLIKDDKMKNELVTELETSKKLFETKSSTILKNREAQDKAIASEVNSEIDSISSRIEKLSKEPKGEEITAIKDDIEKLKQKVNGVANSKYKTDLTSKVNSLEEKFTAATANIEVSKTDEEKNKTKNEKSDQRVIDNMKAGRESVLKDIDECTLTNDLQPIIQEKMNSLNKQASGVVTEKYKEQAQEILDEVTSKYNKKVAEIAQAKAEEESKESSDKKEFVDIANELTKIKAFIREEKGSSPGSFGEDMKTIDKQLKDLGKRIREVSDISKKSTLRLMLRETRSIYNHRKEYYNIKSELDSMLRQCQSIDKNTCQDFGDNLKELGKKVYNSGNLDNQCYYERIECVYMKKLSTIFGMSNADYDQYRKINLKFYRLNNIIGHSKAEKTLKYDAEINTLISELKDELEQLPTFRSRYRGHIATATERYADIKATIEKEANKKGKKKAETSAEEDREFNAKEDQLNEFYLEMIEEEYDSIKDLIENLNHENCSKVTVGQIGKKIKDFENWDIIDKSEIEYYPKDGLALFDKLKGNIKEKAQELSTALKTKENSINKVKINLGKSNDTAKDIEEKLTKLESFFADSNVSTVLKNDLEIKELIIEISTQLNSTKDKDEDKNKDKDEKADPFVKEKARLEKVKSKYDKINKSLNLDFQNYSLEEVENKMRQFKDDLDQVNAATMHEWEKHLSENLESLRPLVAKVKMLGNVAGKGSVGIRFAQLEEEYKKKVEKLKEENARVDRGENYDAYRENQSINVGKAVGEERDIELLKQKVKFGMTDYIKSVSLAEADAKVGMAYSDAIDNLRKFIVTHFNSSGVTDVIASEMFDRKTGKFIGSEKFSYINTNYDENRQSELNEIKKKLAYYVKEAEEKFKLKNKLHNDNYNIVRRILESNLGRSRVVLINEISKKLNIDKQEATKLVGENGELLGEAAKLKDDPRIIGATRNFDRDKGELDSYNSAYKEYYDAREKYNDSNDKYERTDNLQEYNEKRSILDRKCKAVRSKILENLRLDYERVKKKSGKEIADAGFLLGCREIGKDPKEIAKIIRLEDVNFDMNPNQVLNNAKQKSAAQSQAQQEEQSKDNAEHTEKPKQTTKTPEELNKLTEQYKQTLNEIYAKYKLEFRESEEFKSLASEALKTIGTEKFLELKEEVISGCMQYDAEEREKQRGEKPSMKEQVDQINNICKEYEQIGLEIAKAQIDLERLKKGGARQELIEQKENQTAEMVKSKQKVLESKSKMLDDIIETIRKVYGDEPAQRLVDKINKTKTQEYTEDMIYPKTMTIEAHKERIEKKIDYIKSISDDPDLKEKCLDGLLKTIIRASDEYGNAVFKEYYDKYEDLANIKINFTENDYLENAEIFDTRCLELQEKVKNDDQKGIEEIINYISSRKEKLTAKFGSDSKLVKDLFNEYEHKIKEIQIEYKDPMKGFSENDNIMTLEECELTVVKLLAEFDKKKQIVNGQYRKDGTTEEIENKLKNYFRYAEKRFGRGSLAMLKQKTHEKVSGENIERGDVRVQTLKEMFDGVQKDAKFGAFLKAYQALYAAIESGNQDRINQLTERLHQEENNFSDIELEVIKKFIDVATVSKARVDVSKEQGTEKKFSEEFIIELSEKGFDEKKIRELTGNKLSEQEIKKIIENAKMQAPSME